MEKSSILVLDDRANWLDTAYEILHHEFNVDRVQTYEMAVDKITKKDPPYHVIISDIRLNDGDPKNIKGLEIAEYIRDHGGYATIIFWTAYSSLETAMAAGRLNAIDYFEKKIPFDDIRDDFIKKVKEAAEFSKQKRWEKTVLLVENNKKWGEKLSKILYRNGYNSDVLNSYKEAEIKIREKNYRALITELTIENDIMQGFEFIKNVSHLSPETKVIIDSDSGDKSTIRDAFVKYNVTDFYFKEESIGFDEDYFINQIQNIFMPENEVFILIDFEKIDERETLPKFQLSLTVKKYVPTKDNAVSIWLPPNKTEIEFDVALYTDTNPEVIQIMPSSTQKWIIPKDGKAKNLNFLIIPKKAGRFTIYPELFGSEGSWRRMNEISFEIE